jgi:ATP-dependent DNA helicase RecG
MPDYELDESNRVKVGIAGKVLDEKYTRMLQSRSDLDLLDVIGLDKVQKGKGITHAEFKRLKEKKLIEGRRPNLFVSAAVAAATESKAEYIKNRAFNKEYYQNLLVNYLKKYGQAKREDIDNLLFDKLSDALDDNQKRNYIMNLLQKIRRNGTVKVLGKGGGAVWQLHKPTNEDEI